jgi:hypothetical protein
MNCIFAVRLEMKVKFWGRGFAVAPVQGLRKVMDKECEGFAYLRQKFPKVNESKRKEGIFVCPQIKQIFEDHDLSAKWNGYR